MPVVPDDQRGDWPADPTELLPDHSILSFEEYLEMQQAVSDTTRFTIVYRLKNDGAMTAEELAEELDIDESALHAHLDTLVDVGVVEHRNENTPDQTGLHSYYRATQIGTDLLNYGVVELMRREWDYRAAYGGSE